MSMPAIEHRSTSGSRWLRGSRLKLALWIAAIEALLVVIGVIPKWFAFAVALGILVAYFGLVRGRAGTLREVGWIAAVSQTVVLLIPILVAIVGTLTLIAVGAIAVAALVFLLADRR
jgi:hypothetical protein